MRAVVAGMIATYPVGGVAWDYGNYLLGLEQLGFEVYYLEDTGLPVDFYTYNPSKGEFEVDCSYGVQFLQHSLASFSPSLANRWHFRAVDGQTYGLQPAAFADIVASADLLLNVSGGCLLREEYSRCARKVFIDTDPGWNHFVIFPRWDSKPTGERNQGFRAHDYFFTYAQLFGQPDCTLSAFGLPWHPLRPPVASDHWAPRPPACRWTTVMKWKNYEEDEQPLEHDGVKYGSKEMEFARIERLPLCSSAALEVAVNGDAPRERWCSLGWSVAEGHDKSETADVYRSYIESSRGEFSVAKNVYVATRSGWFSSRSVNYLAAGRPVVVQETGFSDVIPTGHGLFGFSDLDEAARAIATVESDYGHHQDAARELAATHFDSKVILRELLDRIEVT